MPSYIPHPSLKSQTFVKVSTILGLTGSGAPSTTICWFISMLTTSSKQSIKSIPFGIQHSYSPSARNEAASDFKKH